MDRQRVGMDHGDGGERPTIREPNKSNAMTDEKKIRSEMETFNYRYGPKSNRY